MLTFLPQFYPEFVIVSIDIVAGLDIISQLFVLDGLKVDGGAMKQQDEPLPTRFSNL